MANERKPSIYSDRGTIGSYDELDEYGVWVKSEPQELAAGADVLMGFSADNSAEELGLEIPDMSDLPDLDNLPDLDSFQEDTPIEEDFSAADLSDYPQDIALEDDFALPEMGEAFASDASEDAEPDTSDLEIDDSDFDEISMDDLIMPLETETEAPPPDDDEFFDSDFSGADSGLIELSEDELSIDEPFGDDFLGQDDGEYAAGDLGAEISGIASSSSSGSMHLSTQLLMKIADELSSIRNELSNLKRDFSNISPAPRTAQEDEKIALTGDELSDILGSPPPPPNIPEDDFLNKEDEKIALTGDELSNILNTADFTEEAGADTLDIDLEDETFAETSLSDFSPIDLDIDPSQDSAGELSLDDAQLQEFDANLGLLELEEIPAEDPLAEDALPDFLFEEAGELNEILENGVEPITPAPDADDSEYLSTDILATDILSTDILSDDSLDLSDAVIDEPDFSADIQDISIEEPMLEDISIDLGTGFDSEEGLLDEQPLDIEDISADFPDPLSSDFEPFETFDPKPSSDGGDLSLIPEGLVVGSEADSLLDSDSADFNPAEFDPVEFGDLANDLDASQEAAQEAAQEAQIDLSETPSDFPIEDEAFSIDDIDNFITEPLEVSGEALEDMSGEVLEIQDGIPSLSPASPQSSSSGEIPSHLKQELRTVLSYMDQLLEALPDEKIEEFAKSEYYDTYKKLFKELGLV